MFSEHRDYLKQHRAGGIFLAGLRWFPLGMLGWLILCAAGCGSAHWTKNGWLDPTQVGQFDQGKRNEIRHSLSILEEPPGIQNAEEPLAGDLQPYRDDIRIGPGDVLSVSVHELLTPNYTTVQQIKVGNSGFETIPMVGPVRVVGLTARELELELKEKLRAAEILPNADVQVSMIASQTAQFSIVGNVMRPGIYPLNHPDVRLLDVLAVAGGAPPTTEKLYVIRKTEQSPAGTSSQPVASTRSSTRRDSKTMGYNSRPFTLSEVSSGSARADSEPSPKNAADDNQTPPEKAVEGVPEWDEERQEWVIREVLPATSPARPQTETTQPPVFTKDTVEMDQPKETKSLEVPPAKQEDAFPGSELAPPTRILEIPMKELMDGDPRYNVVIRPLDLINVPTGNVGEFYLMGNVARPGAFTLSARRMTVKEAIASAGGFGPLAWPSRADLVRRVSDDEEEIIQLDLDAVFAGETPDFYIKPNDIINVGTTIPAYFFAVFRNAFRFSYGMGFVYDRNFADEDTWTVKQQQEQWRMQKRQMRGLPF